MTSVSYDRAISQQICGNERMHKELCARTVCELVCHQDRYLQPEVIALLDASGYLSPNALPAMSASYDKATQESYNTDIALTCYESDCIATTRMDTYSNLWHIHALSSVVGSAIRSVYPEHNYRIRPMFNKIIYPRVQNPRNSCITIMWTRTSRPRIQSWSPNHFVLCIPNQPQLTAPNVNTTSHQPATTSKTRVLQYSLKAGVSTHSKIATVSKEGPELTPQFIKVALPWLEDILFTLQYCPLPLQWNFLWTLIWLKHLEGDLLIPEKWLSPLPLTFRQSLQSLQRDLLTLRQLQKDHLTLG